MNECTVSGIFIGSIGLAGITFVFVMSKLMLDSYIEDKIEKFGFARKYYVHDYVDHVLARNKDAILAEIETKKRK